MPPLAEQQHPSKKTQGQKVILNGQRAFTLIEVVIVISLIAFVYSVALPNLGLNVETEVAATLGRLNGDIRTAFDTAVLTGKPHRLAFKISTGDYWLESTDSPNFYLSNEKSKSDPTSSEEEEKLARFKEEFKKYEDLAGQSVKDQKKDKEITAVSPITKAKNKLMPPKWSKVESSEWKARSISAHLMFKDIRAEHHERAVSMEDDGKDALAYLYFYQTGYVEKAVFHIYYDMGNHQADMKQPPYSLITNSYLGQGTLVSGLKEVDFSNLEESIEDR